MSRWSETQSFQRHDCEEELVAFWGHPYGRLTIYTSKGQWYARSVLWSGDLQTDNIDVAKRTAITNFGKAARQLMEAARAELKGAQDGGRRSSSNEQGIQL